MKLALLVWLVIWNSILFANEDECISSDTPIPLFRLPSKSDHWTTVNKQDLMDAIFNVGFMKLEMTEEAKQLAPEVDKILKEYFQSLDFGRNNIIDDGGYRFGPQWWPQQSTFYGFNNHYLDHQKLIQNEIFYLPKKFVNNSQMNPFYNMQKVMRFFQIMLIESYRILENVWFKLDQYPISDLYQILNGQEMEDELSYNMSITFAVSNYDPNLLQIARNNNDEIKLGLGAHPDAGIFTILKSGGKGFQIQIDSKWIDVDDTDCNEAFIINFGAAMNITTNGLFKAGLHRVLPITQAQRLSIALFNDPNMDGWIYKYDKNNMLQPYMTGKQNINNALSGGYGDT